jgi:Arc/MetJ-type ribon-helix-helix transcriptional regulator
MEAKNKEERINVRVDPDLKKQILKLIDSGQYEDMAGFVRAALVEKIHPEKRRVEITEKQFAEMLVKTLQSNPSILAEQLKDIGLQFVLRE